VPLDDEIETDLDDLGVAGVRMRVGERVRRELQLLEQPPRDGDVDPGQLGRLRLDERRRSEPKVPAQLGLGSGVGTHSVGQPTARTVKVGG
jgi:hypothetical protein